MDEIEQNPINDRFLSRYWNYCHFHNILSTSLKKYLSHSPMSLTKLQ